MCFGLCVMDVASYLVQYFYQFYDQTNPSLPPSLLPPNSIDNAVKRFKREVNKSGHLLDLRFKRYHESNQEKVKRKAVQARRKARMLRLSLRKGQKL